VGLCWVITSSIWWPARLNRLLEAHQNKKPGRAGSERTTDPAKSWLAWEAWVDWMTTIETLLGFVMWYPFDVLKKPAGLSEVCQRRSGSSACASWSAALFPSGQEPYRLSMSNRRNFDEQSGAITRVAAQIVATDLSWRYSLARRSRPSTTACPSPAFFNGSFVAVF